MKGWPYLRSRAAYSEMKMCYWVTSSTCGHLTFKAHIQNLPSRLRPCCHGNTTCRRSQGQHWQLYLALARSHKSFLIGMNSEVTFRNKLESVEKWHNADTPLSILIAFYLFGDRAKEPHYWAPTSSYSMISTSEPVNVPITYTQTTTQSNTEETMHQKKRHTNLPIQLDHLPKIV